MSGADQPSVTLRLVASCGRPEKPEALFAAPAPLLTALAAADEVTRRRSENCARGVVGDCLLVDASQSEIDAGGLREYLAEWSVSGAGRPALVLAGHVGVIDTLSPLVDTGLLSGICVDRRRAEARAVELGRLWRARVRQEAVPHQSTAPGSLPHLLEVDYLPRITRPERPVLRLVKGNDGQSTQQG